MQGRIRGHGVGALMARLWGRRRLRKPSLGAAPLLLFAIALGVLVPEARATQRARTLVVGLDARNGYDESARLARGGDFDDLRRRLVARGLRLEPIAEFTPERLVGLDLLVLQQPYSEEQRFRPEERTAIRSFVARGASLLVHGDAGGRSDAQLENLNQLLQSFGVRFGPTREGAPAGVRENRGWVVDDLVPHPITRGVSSFAVDFPRWMLEIRPPALDLTRAAGRDDVLAAVDRPGRGRVVVLGDASLWMDIDAGSDAGLAAPGNRDLLANILDHLLPQTLPEGGEPVNAPGLRVQLDGLRDTWLGLPERASAVLRLLIPDGAGSGCFVQLSASGAHPGSLMLVLLGEPSEVDTLENPQLLTTVAADAEGRMSFTVLVPASAAGHTFGLRLLDPLTGETSAVMRFEPTRR